MNERAVRASVYPNANIIIIRRESARSLTLWMHALLDATRCTDGGDGPGGGYAPVRRFTLDLDLAKRALARGGRGWEGWRKRKKIRGPFGHFQTTRPESRHAARSLRGNER